MAAAAGGGDRPAVRAAPRDRAHVLARRARQLRQTLRNRARRRPACRPRSGRGGRRERVPASSSSPVRTTVMSALLSVPAAFIARSAATITAIPPLSSPTPGPFARLPLAGPVLERRVAARTPCRDGRSAAAACRGRCLACGRRCGRRGWPRVMSSQSTLKPSGSSSARSMSPTAATPAKFSVPLFWLTHLSSIAMVRSCSASTVRIITCSGAAELGGGGGGERQRCKPRRGRARGASACAKAYAVWTRSVMLDPAGFPRRKDFIVLQVTNMVSYRATREEDGCDEEWTSSG